jgi:NADPH:quinone reductase-like Zn-dependent oxidoreductase
MRAYRIEQFGLDNLHPVDLPTPEPSAGEVLIRMHAASLNYRDLMIVRGQYDPKMKLPRIPLSDGAGEVVAVGRDVTRFHVGDRVLGLFLQNWQEGPPSAEKSRGALGGDCDGVLAEYIVLPESGVASFPAHLSYEEAATLPCAALTAWHALMQAARIRPGDTVVVQGTGGVSLFALQFAKMAGARVLGTSSSDEKLAKAKSLGLDDGVNYKQQPDWSTRVKEQTGGRGADLIVEVGGAGTLAQSLKAIRTGGTITQIGVLSGAQDSLSIAPILMRQIRIFGIYVGSSEMMKSMTAAIALHDLRPVIDQTFSFDQVLAAFQHLDSGRHFGKIAIRFPV